MNTDEQTRHMLRVLIVLAQRAGGRISVSEEELEAARGQGLLVEGKADKAGFRHVDLLPDYVKVDKGEKVVTEKPEEPPDHVDSFEWVPAVSSGAGTGYIGEWKWPTATFGTNVPLTSGSVQIGTATPGPNGTFEMKLSGTAGKAFANTLKADSKMFSIGWDPAGQFKEISVADTPKAPAPDPVPPPEGGGLNTTDPTFANQGGSAPKESKPTKKSDVKKVR